MTQSAVDIAAWQEAMSVLPRSGFDRLLVVQCSLEWLRPSHQALREDVDDLVFDCCNAAPDLPIDRVILHSLPTRQGAEEGDLARLNAVHSEWTYRLASTSMLLKNPALRIHRLIVDGEQRRAAVEDFLDLRRRGSWLWPDRTRAMIDLLATGRGTTPLTGYDLNLDGPFGDADPSVYI
ncbi:hypothetical protein [Streptomyces sp. TS71-3]|uniref:hypothetical protein n=1 Tax=Streptomyces sp. TS71-3 TaxID=2733862 RepID=UPI001B26DDA8|nr:hypothetical protein [Streptomyces sp. TS71-3]GHJ36733.1 hypothetical protein Sm713_23420 [Streptomyces sp. TS71-3]